MSEFSEIQQKTSQNPLRNLAYILQDRVGAVGSERTGMDWILSSSKDIEGRFIAASAVLPAQIVTMAVKVYLHGIRFGGATYKQERSNGDESLRIAKPRTMIPGDFDNHIVNVRGHRVESEKAEKIRNHSLDEAWGFWHVLIGNLSLTGSGTRIMLSDDTNKLIGGALDYGVDEAVVDEYLAYRNRVGRASMIDLAAAMRKYPVYRESNELSGAMTIMEAVRFSRSHSSRAELPYIWETVGHLRAAATLLDNNVEPTLQDRFSTEKYLHDLHSSLTH